jgi:predicted HAD superfamily Cof-like phosphohydrolase
MSKDWYQDIVEFHKVVMQENLLTYPNIPNDKMKILEKKLILEEVMETVEAIDSCDLVELADGIVDSIVVLLGCAVTYGIDIRPIWDEIHKTNMAKKDGEIRADGKKLKPIGWKPPEVARLLNEQFRANCPLSNIENINNSKEFKDANL